MKITNHQIGKYSNSKLICMLQTGMSIPYILHSFVLASPDDS